MRTIGVGLEWADIEPLLALVDLTDAQHVSLLEEWVAAGEAAAA